MTIFEWLHDNMILLKDAGVDSPRRDCLVLLEDLLKKDRAWVLAHPEHALRGDSLQRLNKLIERRINREPLAYIRGKAWFYGRFFQVNSAVLIPRSESESFIEILKQIRPKTVVDIGTGSGCLAITAKFELTDAQIIATDKDLSAIKVARQNAKYHNVKIEFIKSNLLDSIIKSQNPRESRDYETVFIANLPYVPDGLVTSREILHEPKQALFSGSDGLDHYKNFWNQVKKLSAKPQHILTESLEKQHRQMSKFAESSGYELQNTEILVQLFRRRSF